MLANLYGDFVKGKDYTHLPKIIQEGVDLHRQIDDFVDRHPLVTELRLKLYEDLPKIAGIAIDLYFDHLLAKKWKLYHPQPFDEYVDEFFDFAMENLQKEYSPTPFKFSNRFIHLVTIMNEQDWIKQYRHIEGLKMASTGLSSRISFPNNLDEATAVFYKHQRDIEQVFKEYMKEAKRRFNI